ncbi:MAG: acetate--CoA ligase family protein [Oligoflexia bacterium]|nr:acetate--CoA ligase family protein [Oligoflexia bacterium]MBF0365125.1 acetate--CoA ligase family protein [Oligoflexia bacterium]
MSKFIHETKVYDYFRSVDLAVPKFIVLNQEDRLPALHSTFALAEAVVLKGLFENLWHKSDEGALAFLAYEESIVFDQHKKIVASLKDKYRWIENLLVERVKFSEVKGVPAEAFLSFKEDPSMGMVILFGVGGVNAEDWSRELKAKSLMWPISFASPESALAELKRHLIGKVWLGLLRQSCPLTTESILLDFFKKIWVLASKLQQERVSLLEVNPLVLRQEDGVPVPLDGVGIEDVAFCTLTDWHKFPEHRVPLLLSPKSFAISGLSSKGESYGNRIFNNLLISSIPHSSLRVIKPGCEGGSFQGIKAYNDVSALLDDPVDALILVLPAAASVEVVKKVMLQGGGAEIIYLVAGGIGDGGDKSGLGEKLYALLYERRQAGKWTPTLVGPNHLGSIFSPLNLTTIFSNPKRASFTYYPKGHLAFISQSGAFFINRALSDSNIPIKYAYCIGNQMDLKAYQFLEIVASDPDIKTVAIYMEGFGAGEAHHLSVTASRLKKEKAITTILYQGGRGDHGRLAALAHTGAMGGDYDLQQTLFRYAGIVTVQSVNDFTNALKWYASWKNSPSPTQISILTYAGSESVVAADLLPERLLHKVTEREKSALEQIFRDFKVDGLIMVNNPLDLTSMITEGLCLKVLELLAFGTSDALILSLTPFIEHFHVFEVEKIQQFAHAIKAISEQSGKPIALVVDIDRKRFLSYQEGLQSANLPIFYLMEDAVTLLQNLSRSNNFYEK